MPIKALCHTLVNDILPLYTFEMHQCKDIEELRLTLSNAFSELSKQINQFDDNCVKKNSK